MTIYMDISQLEKNRANTGIQRVVKEFLQRVSQSQNISLHVISYNSKISQTQLLDNQELKLFLKDIKNYKFKNLKTIDITTIKASQTTILLELDATWNSPLKREILYPILKENGFLIFNFIYDLTPIILPNFANEITAKNFPTFLNALYQHSDMVFCDSFSAKDDFLNYKESLNISREIKTEVVALGADFFNKNLPIKNQHIKKLLKKKYILFVATLEPRKNQENVLDAFDALAKTHPDLNLIFIGKQGWKIEYLIQKIDTHKLKDKQLFWLNDIDDNTLSHFYQNAFLVTYLSKYEGYGLPITEALQHANIVITSKNSSMHEVGQDFVDYILHDSTEELIETILFYYNNPTLYNQRRKHIKQNFKTKTWDMFYETIHPFFSEF